MSKYNITMEQILDMAVDLFFDYEYAVETGDTVEGYRRELVSGELSLTDVEAEEILTNLDVEDAYEILEWYNKVDLYVHDLYLVLKGIDDFEVRPCNVASCLHYGIYVKYDTDKWNPQGVLDPETEYLSFRGTKHFEGNLNGTDVDVHLCRSHTPIGLI